MNLHQKTRSLVLHADSPDPAGQGRWNRLRLVQGIWIALALMLLVIFVANLPVFFQYASSVCTLPNVGNCPTYQLTPAYVQILDHLHLSVAVAKVFLATLCVAVSVVYWLLGLLIFWRKSQEPIGLLVSLLLVMFGATGFIGFNLPTSAPPLFQLLAQIITHWLMWPAMLVFFFTFPTGRFAPRRAWIAFVPFFVVSMLATIPGRVIVVPGAVIILASLLPVGVQVYRYIWIYDAVQQQQTKWFVFGLSIVFLLIITQGILQTLAPLSGAANFWYQLFSGPIWLLPWTLLLLVVSIPILRYRLWDIDIIINRALVYGSLTALLALLYFGLIFSLQFLLQGIFNLDHAVVIVISTLAIAALFQPLRRRIQALINHRFYRRKYDAARTLAAFSTTLRQEVDVDQLQKKLVAVVQETMQPTHVSLWLRPTTLESKQQTAWSSRNTALSD